MPRITEGHRPTGITATLLHRITEARDTVLSSTEVLTAMRPTDHLHAMVDTTITIVHTTGTLHRLIHHIIQRSLRTLTDIHPVEAMVVTTIRILPMHRITDDLHRDPMMNTIAITITILIIHMVNTIIHTR